MQAETGSGRTGAQHQQPASDNTVPNESGTNTNLPTTPSPISAVSGGVSVGSGSVTAAVANAGGLAAGSNIDGGGGGGGAVSTGGRNSSNRLQLLGYLLSLMRTAHNDHGAVLPPVDVFSHKHTAYLIDAFLYFFKVALFITQST